MSGGHGAPSAQDDKVRIAIAGNAYAIGDGGGARPSRQLAHLRLLQDALGATTVPRGPVRELARTLQEAPIGAAKALERLMQLLQGRKQDGKLRRALQALGFERDGLHPGVGLALMVPESGTGEHGSFTPWIDAMVLTVCRALKPEDLADDPRFLRPAVNGEERP